MRQYDVGTYDKGSNTLFVSDLKLCGLYEDAYPNPAAPSRITVMGTTLEVLPCAVSDLATFKVGEKVTFLLTTTGQVAGAVSPSVAQSNAVGVAKIDSKDSASIELLDGILTLKGKTTLSDKAAQQLNGCLGDGILLQKGLSDAQQSERQRSHRQPESEYRKTGHQDPVPRRPVL